MKTMSLTKTMGYLMMAAMLIAGTIVSYLVFDKLPWAINRWVLYTLTIIMLVVLNQMHVNRRSPSRFFLWSVPVVTLGILEIGSGISLAVYALDIDSAMALNVFDRFINAITLFVLIIYNMLVGVWLSDRVEDIKKNYNVL